MSAFEHSDEPVRLSLAAAQIFALDHLEQLAGAAWREATGPNPDPSIVIGLLDHLTRSTEKTRRLWAS